ncbi:MAG: 4-hydroxythreonine-4-phosphate dehydrogenase PdxA [Bacteroidota bacterium]|nr:4-hydroxythreonine-4-phosphate dehydrogenase PdxA [Bacteroidota bacterium]MDP4195937.1 4-hydroxythreonine-4-phosphate dehydrogenase PdxA [Bacteroidota bacterium]
MKKFVFTCGDINGIGPEIVIKTLNRIYETGDKFIFLCPGNVFENAIKYTKCKFEFCLSKKVSAIDDPGIIDVIDIGSSRQNIGIPTRGSGIVSFKAIRKSFELASKGKVDAIITAPISKHALELANINYPGHTEMYAEWSGAKDFVMMFISKKMNCSLLTIHEPLRAVSKLITKQLLRKKLGVIYNSLREDLGKTSPRLALLGLNPHSGESGRIGKEEVEIFSPILKEEPFNKFLSGPFVPDAFFANKLYKEFDMVIGSYHDQVLIPFKLLNFSSGVNYTAGLPIIRTSPDHGTAFDIAGKGVADESSIFEAFKLSDKIASNRKKWKHKK